VDERVQYLEQIRKEVTAALLIAAREMRNSGPPSLTHTFRQNDQPHDDMAHLKFYGHLRPIADWNSHLI
jgi:hypothetical protein